MRIAFPILLLPLLLTACGDRKPRDVEPEPSAAESAQPDLPTGAGDADPARLKALIDRAITSALPGGDTAQFRNVRAGAGGAACGDVALQSAGFRPFVVTPEAVAVIAAGPALAFEDPSDFAADAWIRWCATPEDLERLAPRLKGAVDAASLEANITAIPEPALPSPDAAPLPAEEPRPAVRPAPAAPPPPQQIDSFFNSVQRPGK